MTRGAWRCRETSVIAHIDRSLTFIELRLQLCGKWGQCASLHCPHRGFCTWRFLAFPGKCRSSEARAKNADLSSSCEFQTEMDCIYCEESQIYIFSTSTFIVMNARTAFYLKHTDDLVWSSCSAPHSNSLWIWWVQMIDRPSAADCSALCSSITL